MTQPVPQAPMAFVPSAPAFAPAPRPTGGWMTQLFRLIGWELFLAWRRRAMVITLGAILLAIYVVVMFFIWLLWVTAGPAVQILTLFQTYLVFPGSLAMSGEVFFDIGTLLLIVIVGALIGSEYSYGTLRLSLARGVGRGQLLVAQVIALGVLALVTSAVMQALGLLVGAVGSVVIGGSQAVTLAGVGELIGFWLAIALNAFAYALIALAIGTLGRSVAGAIAGPLVFIFVEVVATDILRIFSYLPAPNAYERFIGAIPDYFLGTNTGAIFQISGQAPYQFLQRATQIGLAQALIVVVVYCAVFATASYLVFRARDVRE